MQAMRRSASTPELTSSQPLEVYVATRPLLTKLPHVPEHLQTGLLRDVGCAHYYTVLRRPSDGQLTQLDFGPVGGDIAFAPKAPKQGFWAWAATAAGRKPIAPHGTPAEVREQPLLEMPESCMLVGTTNLSLSDIRSFNSLQSRVLYLLHQNDCRHYVNSLVQYTTGVQGVTRKATRHIFRARATARNPQQRLAWRDHLVLLSHSLTDVGAWPRLQRASRAAAAVIAAVAGKRTAVKLGLSLRMPVPAAGQSLLHRVAPRLAPRLAGLSASASTGRLASAASSGAATTALVRRASFFRPPPPRLAAGAVTAAGATYAAAQAELSLFQGLCESLKSAAASGTLAIRTAGARFSTQVGAQCRVLSAPGRSLSSAGSALALGATRSAGFRQVHLQPQLLLNPPAAASAAVKVLPRPAPKRRGLKVIPALIMR
mmetsp:Transcript_13855/g.41844  ORF Transcript_13855/g.41844 Transcript_13855/m.41844 type:complete len:429 (-) Transcript_13855:3288-4574(-)